VQINTIKKHGDKEAAPGGGSSGARVPRSRGAGAGASLRARWCDRLIVRLEQNSPPRTFIKAHTDCGAIVPGHVSLIDKL